MRTTIHVDDQLLMRAKALAAASGITLGKLIEDALTRTGLVKNREPVQLITVKGTGTRAGIDLDDSKSLLDIME
jgi:Ribbon-helix-helix protein, copG family